MPALMADVLLILHLMGLMLVAGGVLTSLGLVSLFSFTGFSSPTVAAWTVGVMFFVASTAFSDVVPAEL